MNEKLNEKINNIQVKEEKKEIQVFKPASMVQVTPAYENFPNFKICQPNTFEEKWEKEYHAVIMAARNIYLDKPYHLTIFAGRDSTRFLTEEKKFERAYAPFLMDNGQESDGETKALYKEHILARRNGNKKIERGAVYLVMIQFEDKWHMCQLNCFGTADGYWSEITELAKHELNRIALIKQTDHSTNLIKSKSSSMKYLNPKAFINFEFKDITPEQAEGIQELIDQNNVLIERWFRL